MSKPPATENALSSLSQQLFGNKRLAGKCVACGKKVNPSTDFRTNLSRREYQISYLCQQCQDIVFGED